MVEDDSCRYFLFASLCSERFSTRYLLRNTMGGQVIGQMYKCTDTKITKVRSMYSDGVYNFVWLLVTS